MTTNADIIEAALREINVLNEAQSASAEQGDQSLDKLNQLMELWKEDSLDLGYFKQNATTDTIPIPDYAEQAVILALAARIAPQYGASLTAESAALLDYSINALRRTQMQIRLENTDMSHMPEGSGHFGNRYDITTDG